MFILVFIIFYKYVKRAGLDYWDSVQISKYDNLDDLIKENPNSTFYYLTTKTKNKYTDIQFKDNDFLVFGPETRGIPETILNANKETSITIPMNEGQRSLNLSNSVAIVVYEAIRQNG